MDHLSKNRFKKEDNDTQMGVDDALALNLLELNKALVGHIGN